MNGQVLYLGVIVPQNTVATVQQALRAVIDIAPTPIWKKALDLDSKEHRSIPTAGSLGKRYERHTALVVARTLRGVELTS